MRFLCYTGLHMGGDVRFVCYIGLFMSWYVCMLYRRGYEVVYYSGIYLGLDVRLYKCIVYGCIYGI